MIAVAALALLAACAPPSQTTDGTDPMGRQPQVVLAGAPRKIVPAPRPELTEAEYAALERGVLEEINRLRTDPSGYAAQIEARLAYYQGTLFRGPGDPTALQTREGVDAVREAVAVLRRTPRLPPLRLSDGMNRAARDHVVDQGRRGTMNHEGSDGSQAWDRVERYGSWRTLVSENMTFGPPSAREVVEELVIDDGIHDRGHRKNLLEPSYHVAGVSCGPHRSYGVMCDIVHAVDFVERR